MQPFQVDQRYLAHVRQVADRLPVFHQFPILHAERSQTESGEIEALVSTFNNDIPRGYFYTWYDRLLPGCFAAALEAGYPAVVYAHMLDEVPIGATLRATETDEGLLVRGRFFIDEVQAAREAHTALSATGGDGRPPLREFSISGSVVRARTVEEEEREVREIEEFDLWEWGPCVRGANVTRLISVGGQAVAQASQPGLALAQLDPDTLAASIVDRLRQPGEPEPAPEPSEAPLHPSMAALLLQVPRH